MRFSTLLPAPASRLRGLFPGWTQSRPCNPPNAAGNSQNGSQGGLEETQAPRPAPPRGLLPPSLILMPGRPETPGTELAPEEDLARRALGRSSPAPTLVRPGEAAPSLARPGFLKVWADGTPCHSQALGQTSQVGGEDVSLTLATRTYRLHPPLLRVFGRGSRGRHAWLTGPGPSGKGPRTPPTLGFRPGADRGERSGDAPAFALLLFSYFIHKSKQQKSLKF